MLHNKNCTKYTRYVLSQLPALFISQRCPTLYTCIDQKFSLCNFLFPSYTLIFSGMRLQHEYYYEFPRCGVVSHYVHADSLLKILAFIMVYIVTKGFARSDTATDATAAEVLENSARFDRATSGSAGFVGFARDAAAAEALEKSGRLDRASGSVVLQGETKSTELVGATKAMISKVDSRTGDNNEIDRKYRSFFAKASQSKRTDKRYSI